MRHRRSSSTYKTTFLPFYQQVQPTFPKRPLRATKSKKMKTRTTILTILAAAMLFIGCSKDAIVQSEYSNNEARYVMDFNYGHTSSRLFAALSPNSNTFCIISQSSSNIGYTLNSRLYGDEEEHHEHIIEEILTRQSRLMGLNNGLIVGYSSLQDGGLYVFDQICPNCYQQNGLASMKYMVDFDSESAGTQVVCPTCKRYYGLLNGGVVVKGESGQKLYRYRANFTSNVFRISNPY